MSGAGFITSTRLRETMSPLEQAWALLKADPRSQAWDVSTNRNIMGGHPDLEGGPSAVFHNRGTIDPNVYSMARRAIHQPGARLKPLTEVVPGRLGTSIDGVKETRGDGGFSNLVEDHLGAISRVNRPEAYGYSEPGSPQAKIDEVHAQGRLNLPDNTPLTPEQQAYLAGLG